MQIIRVIGDNAGEIVLETGGEPAMMASVLIFIYHAG